ncbi:2Fe-2S iron-sulfur cluster-binding protein [Methylococcus geothermalis]|uniref:2Fe-2S iron-sulfur cluster binding domain-containing protein n=1 Tax=Methylococcus geothermalis TaxID=2681310 RepID=A0A858QB97_9GAMM|nr:2Fe-2S iron-sulfur cluster-binding protein [Methylococcus geothermalis]QJD31212.1 2Fe-2S iron-sulfur cluster binding domain-containing protein [Methylococcus geothermalis]
MTNLKYGKDTYLLGKDQSVLDCLVEHGAPVPFSCRSGVCQTCLMRAVRGTPPASSQQGLKDSLKLQNYFLACVCRPTEDIEAVLPHDAQNSVPATVKALKPLNGEIMHVALECHEPLEYRPGQFINLFRDPTLGRSYSLASVPQHDEHLHLHVRRLPDGKVSGWIHEELRPGQTVDLRGPSGDCFYVPGRPEQEIVLIGTGSGLAPLYGILRDALNRGHRGPIRLFHGSRSRAGLYLIDELRTLARDHTNFDYVPCVSGEEPSTGLAGGRAHEVAFREVPDFKDKRLFLCGHPAMVSAAKKRAFLAGASMKDIYADPFNVNAAP